MLPLLMPQLLIVKIRHRGSGTDTPTTNAPMTASDTPATDYEDEGIDSATTDNSITDTSITDAADPAINNEEEDPITDGEDRETVTRITDVPTNTKTNTNTNNEVWMQMFPQLMMAMTKTQIILRLRKQIILSPPMKIKN